MTMNKAATLSVAGLLLVMLLRSPASSQTAPLPTVSVTKVGIPYSCPTGVGWVPGMTCQNATMSACGGMQPLNFVYGYVVPTGTLNGTIVLFSGGAGTMPSTETAEITFGQNYLTAGYQVVQLKWDSAWQNTHIPASPLGLPPPAYSILTGACRPASFLKYVNDHLYTKTLNSGMCAQGSSAGSGAVAYALVWYGADQYLNNVELLSGPVFSNIENGCKVPNEPNVTICGLGSDGTQQYGCNYPSADGIHYGWSDAPQYIGGYLTSIQTETGDNSCQNVPAGGSTSSSSNQNWLNMSIMASGGNLSFPSTRMGGWLCDPTSINCNGRACQNNSAAQGQYFYTNFSGTMHPRVYSLTGIHSCIADEGVAGGYAPDGTLGQTAIYSHMIGNCHQTP
jgi:hypothetical protein